MFDALSDLLTFAGIVVAGLIIWAALSPIETLGWWAGWFGDKIYSNDIPPDGLVRTVPPDANAYVIFFSGVSRVSDETLSYREREFLRRLATALPRAVVIDDIFPYSVNNLALTGQPLFARLWRWALRRKLDGPKLAGYLINVRNIWQISISADKRYGPIFNQAVASVILHGLRRYDYDPGSQVPVYIIAYSGAAQMAVGAVTYLHEQLPGPITVISLGGIFFSDPGLLSVAHLYHLVGSADSAQKYNLISPGKWAIFAASAWNRVRRQGRVTEIKMGPMSHTGRGGYLDANSTLEHGVAFVDKTVATIATIIRNETPLPTQLATGPPEERLSAGDLNRAPIVSEPT